MPHADNPFRDDDRVVFIGCSITQQREYTTHIETYLLQKFPKWKLTFRNAGVGSDSAWMDRRAQGTAWGIGPFLKATPTERERMAVRMITHGLNRDVLPLKPTVATIMYGANDASYGVDLVEAHRFSMSELVAQLRKTNIRVILLGFTPQEPFDAAPNKNLAPYMDADRAFAAREKLPFVDLYHGCMDAIRDAQKADPDYRFTSDAVHPLPHGHALMARVILQRLGYDVRDNDLFIAPTPLASKAIEKNNAYFCRWREIQIPALLAGKLDDADVKAKLTEADKQIAQLESEIDQLRKRAGK